MLSKNTLKKMVQEVSPGVITDIMADMISELQGADPEAAGYQDQIGYLDICLAELKKKTTPEQQPARRRPREENKDADGRGSGVRGSGDSVVSTGNLQVRQGSEGSV